MGPGSTLSVYAALAGNVLVAVTKALAASVTGSSAMLSEAVHSLVDSSDELLLLYGLKRSHARPDAHHPLGYGRELYFWSFIVAVLVFALGSGVSVWEGVRQIQNPDPISHPGVSYAVLLFSALFEGSSWIVSRGQSRRTQGDRNLWAAIRDSRDPALFTVLLEDSAALLGIAIAFASTLASVHLGEPRFDGAASILIGVLLATVAAELAHKCKGLLIGEPADPGVRRSVLRIAEQSPAVSRANEVITIQLAPDQVVAALSLEFRSGLDTQAIQRAVRDIEEELRADQPTVRYLFIKPQDRATFLNVQE